MTIEAGLTALPDDGEPHWNLGGLSLDDDPYCMTGDEGLEDIETDTQDTEHAADGVNPGYQKLSPKSPTLYLSAGQGDPGSPEAAAALSDALTAVGRVVNPLPDRWRGMRMLRWRRVGEPAKRLYYRPANGKALTVAGDEARIKYDDADLVVRLECPDGVIVSDEYEDIPIEAGETVTVTNNGTLTAVLPLGWSLTAETTVTLQNLDHDESITFPSTGHVTVSRTLEIITPTTYGIAYGPAGSLHPRVPFLRPGDNEIKASADCTLRKWDSW